jgi:hypothetical protein
MPERNRREKWSRALMGFGAGVQGRGPEFVAGLQDQDRRLDEDRRQALLEDAFTTQQMLQSGDTAGTRAFLMDRIQNIERLGGDPSDTMGVLQKLDSGDVQGALRDVSTVVDFGVRSGRLTAPPQSDTQLYEGQAVTIGAGGRATASPIEGYQPSPDKALDRDLRRRQLELSEATEERLSTDLSAGLEKALLDSQDAVVKAQQSSNQFANLANEYETRAGELQGGAKLKVSEGLKAILGSEDEVTEFRRRFNQVRLSEGLKLLPPGPATDRDVQEAFKGVPRETASPEQVASFLRGAARLARFDAAYNQLKADFITNKRTGAGLNQAWRRKLNSPVLHRAVTIAEIYETAQNRGISPEEVIEALGITEEMF